MLVIAEDDHNRISFILNNSSCYYNFNMPINNSIKNTEYSRAAFSTGGVVGCLVILIVVVGIFGAVFLFQGIFGEDRRNQHKHPFGDGWVDNSASVAPTVYVDINARVRDRATVTGDAEIMDFADISGDAIIENDVTIRGNARVTGQAHVRGKFFWESTHMFGTIERDRVYIRDNAVVCDMAFIESTGLEGGVRVSERAEISGEAKITGSAQIHGRAKVGGKARVLGSASIGEDAVIEGECEVFGNAKVYGSALIDGSARIKGDAQVTGNSHVTGDAKVTEGIVANKTVGLPAR